MKRYNIFHQTDYTFRDPVELLSHTLRLRPREGHDLHIETSALAISPTAVLRWQRDVEGNTIAIANFTGSCQQLRVKSDIIIQQYDRLPYNFLIDDAAIDYPFHYHIEDQIQLTPYMRSANPSEQAVLRTWIQAFFQPHIKIKTLTLLLNLNQYIYQSLIYCVREEEGVQSVEETVKCGTGSCRDAANLFMATARYLGFAARFVSGYIFQSPTGHIVDPGATHAWAEVYIPGAGWKGFDSTMGVVTGVDHIAVSVARLPEAVPPIAGSFIGSTTVSMDVQVQITALNEII